MMRTLLDDARRRIRTPDEAAAARAAEALDGKTKPPGSLGRLEELAIRLAGIHGRLDFSTEPRTVVVFAADHGVVRRGVSAYPREVTAQMVANFAAGGAAVNVLAREMRAATRIVDVGVDTDAEWPASVVAAKVARGTADMTETAAMTRAEAEAAIELGIGIASALSHEGAALIATGDMGIGNTTAAAALSAAFTGRSPEEVTGRGTGIDDHGLERKRDVVRRALDLHRPDAGDALGTLAAVGGLELAALAGLIVGAAAERLPVVLDGFIAGASALAAVALAPGARASLVAGHRSAEPGHRIVLDHLGLEPLLDLGLRLGEGTGALLALPLLDSAGRILREMASFESAGVSRG